MIFKSVTIHVIKMTSIKEPVFISDSVRFYENQDSNIWSYALEFKAPESFFIERPCRIKYDKPIYTIYIVTSLDYSPICNIIIDLTNTYINIKIYHDSSKKLILDIGTIKKLIIDCSHMNLYYKNRLDTMHKEFQDELHDQFDGIMIPDVSTIARTYLSDITSVSVEHTTDVMSSFTKHSD